MKEAIKAELLAIRDANPEGLLLVDDVITFARSHPKSALHGAIDWDDRVAAERWRRQQARRLIEVHIVSEGGERQTISLSIDRAHGGGYRDVADVARNRDLLLVAEQDALHELMRARVRYGHIRRFKRVWVELDRIEKRMKPKEIAETRASA